MGTEGLAPTEIFEEEVFEELEPLLDLDGSEAEFAWDGKTFVIAAFGEDTSEGKEVLFGLWEKADFGFLSPVGYIDTRLERHSCIANIKKFDIKMNTSRMPDKFTALNMIKTREDKDYEEGDSAFLISPEYRGSGVADVFHSQFLYVLNRIGIEEVILQVDKTVYTDEIENFLPQFKHPPGGASNEVRPVSKTSFYSKYATDHFIDTREFEDPAEIEEDDESTGFYITHIETKLSSMQISLLHEAFGHYEDK